MENTATENELSPMATLAVLIIVTAIHILAVICFLDHHGDNPIRNSREHLEENRQRIRDLVEATVPRGTGFQQEPSHKSCSWHRGTARAVETICTIEYRLTPPGEGVITAEYFVEMERGGMNRLLTPKANYPIQDAYLDGASVHITRNPVRLEPEAGIAPARQPLRIAGATDS